MRKIILLVALFTSAPGRAGIASNGPFQQHCVYDNYRTNEFYEGACSETWDSNGSRLEAVYMLPKRTLRIVYGKSQGKWTNIKFGTEPGMRYEIDRTHYEYTTLDVNGEELEVSDVK